MGIKVNSVEDGIGKLKDHEKNRLNLKNIKDLMSKILKIVNLEKGSNSENFRNAERMLIALKNSINEDYISNFIKSIENIYNE